MTDQTSTGPGEGRAKGPAEGGGDDPAQPAPIQRRKLADEVFDRLRGMIASGALAPGAALPSERELMARFAVGRPAVREALQSMHTLGLITISHGGRSRVNALTAGGVLGRLDEVAQLYLASGAGQLDHLKEARVMVETGIIRRAAVLATPDDVAALRALVARQRAARDAPRAFVEADIAFHARIAAITGNPIIAAASESMLKWLFRFHDSLLRWSGHEDVTLAEHDRIVDLIAARDPEGAAAAMRAHLDRAAALYRNAAG